MSGLLSLHPTIRDIDADAWNQLTAGNAFASHAWLLTTENCCRSRLEPVYFTLHRDAVLIAASVCYVLTREHDSENLDDILFGRLKRYARAAGLSFLPAFVCGPALGYGWHIGVHPELPAPEILALLLDAMESEACSRRLELTFTHVLDEETQLKSLLAARGYLRCLNVPVAVLDLRWPSFDAYLAHVPRKTRFEFRRQINRHRDSGAVTCSATPAAAGHDHLLGLLDGNSLQHNAHPFPFGPAFFAELERNFGAGARIFTTRKAGVITAVSFMLIDRGIAFVPAIGVDRRLAARDYTYFQITYNAPIAAAIDAGLVRVYYGRGMYQLKLRRGCRLTGNSVYIRVKGPGRIPARCWFFIASLWNRYKLPGRARTSS